jgi:hypothetical protein
MTNRRPAAMLCDVSGLGANASALDGMARLQLEARRAGVEIMLSRPSRRLRALLEFAGLAGALGVETVWEAEEREEGGRVEEERDPSDPPS